MILAAATKPCQYNLKGKLNILYDRPLEGLLLLVPFRLQVVLCQPNSLAGWKVILQGNDAMSYVPIPCMLLGEMRG